MTTITAITNLSDLQLLTGIKTLMQRDRMAQVEFLWHLAELDRRQLYLGKGYPSLWEYCRRELLLSEGESGRRIACARGLIKAPKAADMLRDGSMSPCAFAVLTRVLTEANAGELLDKAKGLSKRETEDLVAAMTPTAAPSARRDVIRAIAPCAAVNRVSVADLFDSTPENAKETTPVAAEATPAMVHRVAFDADDEIVAQIKRLKDLLGERELKEIIRRANAALLDKIDPMRRHERRLKKKIKKPVKALIKQATQRPQPTVTPRQPAAVRDAVAVRDGGRCTYVSVDGVRCCATRHLHVDHVRPFALGGSSTDPENNRLLCAAHNLMRAKQTFGVSAARRT